METLAITAGRFIILAGLFIAIFGWRERPQPPRQPKSFQPYPLKVPTQVRPPDPIPTTPETVSVLVKPDLNLLSGVCPPLRKPVPLKCEVLTDLACRLKNPGYWADPTEPDDLITHAHEMNHGVSNRLHASTIKHGIYLGNGTGIILPHPQVTIKHVADRVPKDQRGKVYDLYMVQQRRDWNKSPIYILDETVAYYTGCVAHKQLGYGKHRSETFEFAKELQRYSEVLVDTVRKLDPTYPEMVTLEKFVRWQGDRLTVLGEPNRGH
jgi:hypothetical protein